MSQHSRRPWFLVAILAVMISSCSQNSSAPIQARPSSVTGVALDTQGRPIAGAKVWIEPALTTGLVETSTDSNGVYLVTDLPDVPFNAKAWSEVDFGGERFCMRLGMPSSSDYASFSPEAGVVRNFQWQLSGVIEDLRDYNGYFGAEIRLFIEGDMRGGDVELTFTPTGPLIDGSMGQTITKTINVTQDLMVYDVPVGTYSVASALLEGGTRTPLKTGIASSPNGYAGQTDVAALGFTPSGCSNANGTERAFLYLVSPYPF